MTLRVIPAIIVYTYIQGLLLLDQELYPTTISVSQPSGKAIPPMSTAIEMSGIRRRNSQGLPKEFMSARLMKLPEELSWAKNTYQIILSTKARRFILKIAPSLKDPSKRLQQKSGNAKLHGLQTIFLMLPPGPFGSSHPRTEFCKTYRRSLENNWEPTSWL